ncbi:MAG: HAD family phosphatase [Chloroflexota bacterium]|nr:MAG: HAD family phosphatase [Chloroflexota bacterium]
MSQDASITRAVLWDMDGVLVDTGEAHYQAWVKVLAGEGIPFDRDIFRQTFGMNNQGMLSFLLGHPPDPHDLKRIGDLKESIFRQAIRGEVQLLPGARKWLERLKAAGWRQALASSAPQENIDSLVDELDIRPYFTVLLSATALPGKPDPAVFLEAARQVGVTPGACTVIEDSIPGVEAARRAGMRCIAVTTTNPYPVLVDAGADLVVNSLEELSEEMVPG